MNKSIITSLLIVLMSMIGVNVSAHDIAVKNADGVTIYYTYIYVNNIKALKVSYRGNSYGFYSNEYSGKLVIPKSVTYEGTVYSVTSIESNTFRDCSGLTSVTIPNTVTSIGGGAFCDCSSLTSVTIPNTVTIIYEGTFRGCSSLTSVTIPNNVISIGYDVFRDCTGLTSVTIPNSLTSIPQRAFYGCSKLTSVTIPNSVITIYSDAFTGTGWYNSQSDGILFLDNWLIGYKGKKPSGELAIKYGTKGIAHSAFSGCSGLTSVTIPNSVTSINQKAFYNCSCLTSITIPNSMTYIGIDAFTGTGWYNSQSDGILLLDNWVIGYKGNKPSGVLAIKDGTKGIAGSAFNGCSGLTSVTIPNSVTSIGNSAFYDCKGLTSATVGNGVTTIDDYAFYNCSGLTSFTIPNSVTSIGGSAFYACSGLTSVTIPNSVTRIGGGAFNGCSGLTSITIPNSVTSIGNSAFQGCSGLTSIFSMIENPCSIDFFCFITYDKCVLWVPKGTANKYRSTECWKFFTTIKERSVDLSVENADGVTILYTYMNNGTELMVANNYYSGIVNIPEEVSYKGKTMKVTSIDEYAFKDCSGLTSVTIPKSVTSIGNYAFQNCSGLLDMFCYAVNVPTTGSNAFKNSNIAKATLHVPASSVSAYKATTPWSGFKEIVAIGGTDDEVGETEKGIFAKNADGVIIYYNYINNGQELEVTNSQGNTSYLGVVNIPESVTYKGKTMKVTSIGSYAFSGCSGLTSITIPNSVTSIENYAFNGCSGLTSITIPNSVTSIGNYAFWDCSGLTSVTIGNSVTSIGDFAFWDCSGLTSVTIGNSVTSIGNFAFWDCSGLTSVTIGNSVTTIAKGAFYNCSGLTSVTIPNGVTSIGEYAFSGCSGLPSVTIPNSVTSIGEYAFSGCSGLTSITIPNGVTNIGSGAFACGGLTSIKVESGNTKYDSRDNCNAIIETTSNKLIAGCKNTTIPNSVTSIGQSAFGGCSGLTSITIPNSVMIIGEYAFSGCSGLTSITIPIGVTSIGNYAFQNCSGLLDMYCYAENVPTTGSDAFKNSNIANATLHVPALSVGAYKATTPWSDFKEIVAIGGTDDEVGETEKGIFAKNADGVTIYYVWIKNNTELEVSFRGSNFDSFTNEYTGNVVIPQSVKYNGSTYNVTSIGGWAFLGCSGLTSITIPNSVTSIGDEAIRQCSGLTSITIPNSVTSIGVYAFEECIGLTSVTIPNSVTNIGGGAFACGGLTSIKVESGNTKYDSRDNCNAIIETTSNKLIAGCKNTTIPNSVTSIGNSAFYNCSGLTSVTIPNSVTSIGNYAFDGCSGLTSITIPNSVTSIGSEAFAYCSGLTSIVIPNSVTSIGDWAFLGCSGLTSVTIPNGVTSIGYFAFWDCSGLTSVTIGNSVTTIAIGAFNFCTGLTSIKVESGNTKYDSRDNCNAIIETTSNTLIAGCKNTTIPNSVTSIGDWAFLGCSGLTSITIPNSVTSIGANAFSDCSGLLDMYCYAENVPTTGNNAFENSNIANATLHVPASSVSTYKATTPWSGFKEIVKISTQEAYIKDGVTYDIDGNSVSVTHADNAKGDITIEESVSINGQTYNVTAIADGAFKGCIGLTSVEIPNTVTTVGKSAFEGCSGLIIIKIGKGIKEIGSKAFANIAGGNARTRAEEVVLKVYCEAEVLPSTSGDAFENSPIDKGTLYVIDELVGVYKVVMPWNGFGTIVGLSTGINSITIDSEGAWIFDMQGNRLDNVRKGVNIIRTKDGKTKKMMVK